MGKTAFYDPYINAFVPEQKQPKKIQQLNELGEVIEIDDPNDKPLVEYTKEEIDGFFALMEQGYTMSANPDGTVKMTPPDENEIAKQQAQVRITELKAYLSATDYQAIKFAEGELSAEDYADMKAQRAEWRAEINQLEEKTNNLGEDNNE